MPLAFYKSTPTSLFSELDFLGWTFKANDEAPVTKGETTDDHKDKSAKRKQIE